MARTPTSAEKTSAIDAPPETPAPSTPWAQPPAATEPVEPVETPTEIPPVEESLTLEQTPGDEPTGDDGRPDGFLPGDQTAAGALTPSGGRHPGGTNKPRNPNIPVNLLDPHNVNGTARNLELIGTRQGIKNPLID